MTRNPTFFVSAPCCPTSCTETPEHIMNCIFQVAWSINPHMKVGAVCSEKAIQQHAEFTRALKEAGARVISLPFVHGAYDSVFIKDSVFVKQTPSGARALIPHFAYAQRKVESKSRKNMLAETGTKVVGQTLNQLEGGDIVISRYHKKAYMGFGFRTDFMASTELSVFLGMEVIPLELKDPRFYHLDVALAVLNDGTALACEEAFTELAWKKIRADFGDSLIKVTVDEALKFGLNNVEVGNTVIMGSFLPRLIDIFKALGKRVRYTPLDQFQLAGGSAACLVSEIHGSDIILPTTVTLQNQSAHF